MDSTSTSSPFSIAAECEMNFGCGATLVWNGTAFTVAFPGATESCSCFVRRKRNVVIASVADDDIAILWETDVRLPVLWNMLTSFSPSGTLAAECTRKGIPHHHFHTSQK
ncbi:MAG: hypothetical protein IPP80_10420 [Ignavibacteria bacterium]|nr:hypothetical protein [Ignavibacteria bacterium]